MNDPHAHCHRCGHAYDEPLASFPRTCPACGSMVWSNPVPVCVLLVPVLSDGRSGLLVIRRGIEPEKGKIALVGGFLEDHEGWQAGGAREVLEETGIQVDVASVKSFWFTSTKPQPNRILLFGTVASVEANGLPAHDPDNAECPERGAVFGPEGLDELFAFSLHAEAARRYFAEAGVTGSHGYREL